MAEYGTPLDRLKLYLSLSLRRGEPGVLSPPRQILEMLVLLLARGNGPGYYHTAGFSRSGIPFSQKWSHLNGREYQRRIQRANAPAYQKLSQNKIAEKGILTLLGFPTPRCLGVAGTEDGRARSGSPLRTAEELEQLLRDSGLTRVCFKPIEGWAGQGFQAVEVRRAGESLRLRPLHSRDDVSVEDFHRSLLRGPRARYLIEEYITQHPEMQAFNPSSVNTLRLWVVEDGVPEVVVGYLRIGRSGSLVDNQTAGGIVAPLNLETGILGGAIDGTPRREKFPVHPDHGAPIEGQRVPFLKEAKALAGSALGPFSEIRFAGLDVAITPSGPMIVELNVNPDRKGAAFVDVATGDVMRPFR